MRLIRLTTTLALLSVLTPIAAIADAWGPWQPFGGTGLSIRFVQVSRDICTWAFRNDSSRTLGGLNFRIDDINAETGQSESSNDLLPYSLRPGQSVGGWTAFSAGANCSTVRITSTNMEGR